MEADQVLASPWYQLFSPVQSPNHVLSELLQNADDAVATWVRAYLEDNVFYFEHNGKDFDEESLYSLCHFGFSNKRSLHTIEFRGMGFKVLKICTGPNIGSDHMPLITDLRIPAQK